jgi:hypothetical protein
MMATWVLEGTQSQDKVHAVSDMKIVRNQLIVLLSIVGTRLVLGDSQNKTTYTEMSFKLELELECL